MTDRNAIGAAIAREWPSGVCHFCDIRDEHVDGDRRCWLGVRQTVCNAPGCVIQFNAAIDRTIAMLRRSRRKRSPGEIHQLQAEERRQKRRRYKAKQAQRKGRAA
jgi:hypothetical protein